MKTTTTNNTTTNRPTEDIYTTAEKAVYIALRARHEKSGLQFLAELQDAQSIDKKCRTAPQIAEQIAHLKNELEPLRQELAELHKLQEHADRQAVSLRNSADTRKAWATYSADLNNRITPIKADIKRLCTNINLLYDSLDITYTDRADLTQVACLQIIENEHNPAPITKTVLASYGASDLDELTKEEVQEAQQTANFRAVINAVGKAINTAASPEALNRTVTSKRQATDEDMQKWLEKYGATGADFKVPQPIKRCRQSDCYDTMEYKDTKTLKGWYIIKHYKTVAPYQYIEDFNTTEDGENDINYIKNYNPFVSNTADLDRIEELYKTADLTDRQRLFLEHFCRRCRISADFKDCKDYAFSKIGITTESNKTTFFNRLKNRLKEQINK